MLLVENFVRFHDKSEFDRNIKKKKKIFDFNTFATFTFDPREQLLGKLASLRGR